MPNHCQMYACSYANGHIKFVFDFNDSFVRILLIFFDSIAIYRKQYKLKYCGLEIENMLSTIGPILQNLNMLEFVLQISTDRERVSEHHYIQSKKTFRKKPCLHFSPHRRDPGINISGGLTGF